MLKFLYNPRKNILMQEKQEIRDRLWPTVTNISSDICLMVLKKLFQDISNNLFWNNIKY